ncbi:glycine betaine ABC transporter substrate-binding protein [Pistricoccus aurantiacus]|uniref:Glycine betaine ABC transporter substrate-binding protein n=1 Tax=Pistricoccus aurantiacus TaxID=1883414 RepID=A0A5B8SSE9_9GAMM|nr:glycine betaine ABC transporter substrate-binding protein [Pistricoccus aurantiacus]QEA39999.1 glycine betaine ABC transporter substrate-binding protein [Pistricoccus aurantiacus]
MQTMKLKFRGGAMLLAASVGMAGLAMSGNVQAQEDKGTVTLAYVEWVSTVASTNVVRALLEERGYDVKMSSLSGAAMWQALSYGDADAIVAAWLPTTHEDYYAKVKDSVVDLGPNLEGTKLGLVVPSYTEMDSIEDIKENPDALDGQIVGIDPGAGIMRLTYDVIDEYDLDVDLRTGSGATMTAALGNAIKNEEDIAVTGWTPHWMFARWDVKYLDDPKNVYGGAEKIHTIVREGFQEDMPEAAAVLDNFHWSPEDMEEVMLMNLEEGTDPLENAKKWIADNRDQVDEWLEGVEETQQ